MSTSANSSSNGGGHGSTDNTLLLSHFCERDGPSVLFCTHRPDAVQTHRFLASNGRSNASHGCGDNGNRSADGNDASALPPPLLSRVEYVTLDKESRSAESINDSPPVAVYLSSHYAHSEYASKLKNMCLRSLSVEYVGPGREGPVLFGSRDQNSGYQLAYVFRIKDAKARGFTRWFSFLLIHSNLGMLTLSWSFVQKALSRFVRDVKARAQEVFDQEAQKARQRMISSSVSGIMTYGAMDYGPSSSVGGFVHSHRGSSAAMIFRQKRSSEPLRSLPDLLQNQHFFKNLHSLACSILKAFSERLVVTDSLRNYPESSPTVTKIDTLHALHFREPEGHELRLVTLAHMGQLLWRYYSDEYGNKTPSECYSDDDDDRLSTTSISSSMSISRMLSSAFGTQRRENKGDFKRQQREYQKAVHTIIYNVLVGNQIVIRGHGDMSLANDMCLLLAEIVPLPCVSMNLNSGEYKQGYLANFLTIDENVDIPDDYVDFDVTLVLDVRGSLDNGLEMFKLRYDGVMAETTLSPTVESLFNRGYMKSLDPNLLNASVLPSPRMKPALPHREVSHVQQRALEKRTLQVAKLEWTNKARTVMRAMAQLQSQQELDYHRFLRRVLQTMKVEKHDYRVLRYFGTGLKTRRTDR